MWLSPLLVVFAALPASNYGAGIVAPGDVLSDSKTSPDHHRSSLSHKLPDPKFVKEIFNVSALPLDGSVSRVRVVLKTVENGHKKFTIDFSDKRDLELHFNNRFKEGRLVINSMYNRKWQSEERISSPFKYSDVYTVDFIFNGTAPTVSTFFLLESRTEDSSVRGPRTTCLDKMEHIQTEMRTVMPLRCIDLQAATMAHADRGPQPLESPA